jgi:DNA-binding GntR family transcriptional regulator
MTDTRLNPDSGYSAELAYQSIREQILSGELEGGQWLREGDLAAIIGVSRTPVREALNRLAAEGLVQHERNRGVQVQSWTREDLDEVFGLRSILEPWACALAATKGNVDMAALEQLVNDMDAAADHEHPDVLVMTELNDRFHHTILEATGNIRLISILSSIQEIPLRRRTYSHFTPEDRQRSLSHHHELVNALRVGDAAWAESVMRAHLRAAWNTARLNDESPHPTSNENAGGTETQE